MEYDVNSPTLGIGRDAFRFIAGGDGKIYLTRDHYKIIFRIIKKEKQLPIDSTILPSKFVDF